jgi:hypothetical protein
MDVTNLNRGPGLSEAQLSRLAALEKSTGLTEMQRGEVRFLSMQGTPEQRERALQLAERATKATNKKKGKGKK